MMLGGQRLNIAKIKTPAFFQAAKEDHIAPAVSVYNGAKLFGGPVKFVLAGSGNIAGVINPPAAGKYQHWTNDALPASLEEWHAGATEHPGSWWPAWEVWLGQRSGEKVAPPSLGTLESGYRPRRDAPGMYVLQR